MISNEGLQFQMTNKLQAVHICRNRQDMGSGDRQWIIEDHDVSSFQTH